jgi:hypothetical protein
MLQAAACCCMADNRLAHRAHHQRESGLCCFCSYVLTRSSTPVHGFTHVSFSARFCPVGPTVLAVRANAWVLQADSACRLCSRRLPTFCRAALPGFGVEAEQDRGLQHLHVLLHAGLRLGCLGHCCKIVCSLRLFKTACISAEAVERALRATRPVLAKVSPADHSTCMQACVAHGRICCCCRPDESCRVLLLQSRTMQCFTT